MRRKDSGSFLKKRTKKLLLIGGVVAPRPAGIKNFLLLFYKKEALL
jgi:hypothetical protein